MCQCQTRVLFRDERFHGSSARPTSSGDTRSSSTGSLGCLRACLLVMLTSRMLRYKYKKGLSAGSNQL
ncbi:uncharacterized protein YALI1_E09456g [Yarrowia lipolytica]|uniref:Uncharacterized protein n=1 Tax=Yarrowia lipolytica TaxID=4952 RepID=A0A1D8NHJ0_YARLL|nr:hypothetical protein YALI1_E09456g [Yarrowia lipolytica]